MRIDTELNIRVVSTDLHVLNMRTRMPFKSGIATMTALPHLFLRSNWKSTACEKFGIAADGLRRSGSQKIQRLRSKTT